MASRPSAVALRTALALLLRALAATTDPCAGRAAALYLADARAVLGAWLGPVAEGICRPVREGLPAWLRHLAARWRARRASPPRALVPLMSLCDLPQPPPWPESMPQRVSGTGSVTASTGFWAPRYATRRPA